MAKQTFTTGQVLTAAQMTSLQQTAMGGGAASTKTASYVLVAADAGTVIQMNNAGATTITVNTSLFAAGDSVQIQNIGAGVVTITAGTATVNTAGSLAVSQYDGGFLYFTSASSAIWFDYTQASSASAFVGCRITQSPLASQSIANNTSTDLTFNSETYDTDGFHDTSTNTARITIPTGKAGKYAINAHCEWVNNSSGTRNIYIFKNGTSTIASQLQLSQANDFGMELNTTADLAVGDYITLQVYQTSGSSRDITKRTDLTYFSVTYLGA
jgi:hypothetical protein